MTEHDESEMRCITNTPEKMNAAVVAALVAVGLAATERPTRTSGSPGSAARSASPAPASARVAAAAAEAVAEPGEATSAPPSWPS